MVILNFVKRNFKEIIRDPLSVIFAIILPMFLLFIFQQFNIPSDSYKIENFTPGIIIFGFSFIEMFTAILVSKDRKTSFLVRLCVSPMKTTEYILGYIFSILLLVIIQNVLFFLLSIILGLSFSINIIYAIFISLFISILFISIGILIGSVFSDKAASGISSIIVQLVCFTSGMYFPKELVGNLFSKICEYLPFEACVNIVKGVMQNNIRIITLKNVIVFLMYIIIILVISGIVFKKNMTSDER